MNIPTREHDNMNDSLKTRLCPKAVALIICLSLLLGGACRLWAEESQTVKKPAVRDAVKTVVLLADDFEAAEAGKPILATSGKWQGNDGAELLAVADGGKTPGAPHENSRKWAKLDRAAGGRIEGLFDVMDLGQIGGKLSISFLMYVERNDADALPAGAVFDIGLGNTLAGRVHLVAGRNGGNAVTSNDGEKTIIDRKIKFKDKAWQKWQIWLDIDKGTYEYALDSVKSGPLKLRDNGGEAIRLIEIEPGTAGDDTKKDSVLYLDDVRVEYQVAAEQVARLEKSMELVRKQRQQLAKRQAAAKALIEAGSNEAYYLYAAPQNIGHRTQLFLNPTAYADRWDVRAVPDTPIKSPHNPVVEPDQLWEHSIGLPNVLYDKDTKTFHMWYANYDTGAWGGSKRKSKTRRTPYMMSYAHSKDGTHWTKPLMDKVPYMDYEKTNIVMLGNKTVQEFRVIHTPKHLREQGNGKFMLWYRDTWPGHGKSVGVAYSNNAIDWKEHLANPVYSGRALDAQHCPVYVEEKGYWLLYGRPMPLAANEGRYHSENIRTRIGVAVSYDMKTWTPMRHCLAPDDLDLPKQDPAEVDRHRDPENGGFFFDRMAAIRYGNQFLGFLAIQPRRGSGRGWIEMATSSDGFHWHRAPGRQPLISFGEGKDWDAGHVWCLSDVVEAGPWLYLYYTGSSQTWRTRYPDSMRAIGMAKIKRGRFIGQHAGYKGGWLLTREVKVTGNRLLINISPEHRAWSMKSHGKVQVELCDRDSRTSGYIKGYGQSDCDYLSADDWDQVVRWKKTGEDLTPLVGKKIIIRFWMQNAYLFGFRFANAEDLDKLNDTSW